MGYGNGVLKQLVQLTGGRPFFSNGIEPFDLNDSLDLIQTELRHQYLLGYVPTNQAHDGKWRQIKVKLDVPRGFPKLHVRTREGYFSPN